MMKAGWFKKKSIEGLSLEEIYRGVPYKNETVVATKVSKGVVLNIPLKKPTGGWRILTWLMPIADKHTVLLDNIGLLIYDKLNGKADVEQLIREFADDHKLGLIESRELVVNFLKKLLKRGAVVVALERKTYE